ncbi:GNAT family N-acetyltransferase [Undibacterium sp. SXout7W]|uniref:GNAT family N-acetyltransferase n=1 Tax=Undibacterium sp. SXout7W TaxID=3413049 RepID=UPI003BF06163
MEQNIAQELLIVRASMMNQSHHGLRQKIHCEVIGRMGLMDTLRMTDKADLKVFYDADMRIYTPEWVEAHGISEEDFIAYYRDSPSIGFECGNVPFGGAILHGNDIHVAILPEFHGKWATLLPSALEWIFSQRDEVFGKAHRANRQSLRFIRRFGCKLIRSDEHFLIFSISRAEIPPALRRSNK